MADNDIDFVRYMRNCVNAYDELQETCKQLQAELDQNMDQAFEEINKFPEGGCGRREGKVNRETIERAVVWLRNKSGLVPEELEELDVMFALALVGQQRGAL